MSDGLYEQIKGATRRYAGVSCFLISITLLVDRMDTILHAVPNVINKPKPELVLAPPKLCDMVQEEFWREYAGQKVRRTNV